MTLFLVMYVTIILLLLVLLGFCFEWEQRNARRMRWSDLGKTIMKGYRYDL